MEIAVSSGKGGTGKTFIATNLAVTLAGMGEKVTYLDCDVEEPNGHLFLKPRIDRQEDVVILSPVGVDEDKCVLCGKCAEVCHYNAIQKLKAKIETVAPTNSRVLIYGENGSGKELIAHLIHQKSPRKNKRFIQINCAAIPEILIDSELFGYVKGTFPNAVKDKKGKLLIADGGTLFLDEIGGLSLKTQVKLVKFIEEQKFEPLGSTDLISADTRIIAATDKNLSDCIAEGKFRKDLFFKLNVIPMVLPPLRERKEDIPLLINYFLKYFSIESGKKQKNMDKEAMEAFINYDWPGNVSELINVIERFVIMIKEDKIKAYHLYLLVEPRESQFIPGLIEDQPLMQAREQFERVYIHKSLMKHSWDLTKTASNLNIEKELLCEKIKNMKISFLG